MIWLSVLLMVLACFGVFVVAASFVSRHNFLPLLFAGLALALSCAFAAGAVWP